MNPATCWQVLWGTDHMTVIQRIKEIVAGLFMLLGAAIVMTDPENGYIFIIFFLSIFLAVMGVRRLFYYFTMARFMVDGKESLYKGVIMLDFGALTGSLTDVPKFYILIYLIAVHAFSGLVEILRAGEAKGQGAGSWRFKMVHGIIDMVMAVICAIFINEGSIAALIYGIGLIYSALTRIVLAFRKTRLVYIQ